MQHPGLSRFLSAAVALALLVVGCSEKASRDAEKEETPYTRKVDSSIREVVARITSDGPSSDPTQYSSASGVQVDDQGRIHCYIALDPLEGELVDSLRGLSVTVEREEPTLSLVQAWVPFDLVQQLSELSFVRRIRPPDYPAPR